MAADAQSAFQLLAAALNRHTVPLLIVDAECRILLQNDAAQRLIKSRSFLSERAGALNLLPAGEHVQLEKVLLQCGGSDGNGGPKSRGIRVARAGSRRDWLLLVHPLRSGHLPPGSAPTFLIQVMGRVWPRDIAGAVAVDLFGLTPAELAVVTALSRGSAVTKAAMELGISPETVRSHLKHIFRKCEVASQGELLALLTLLATFGGG